MNQYIKPEIVFVKIGEHDVIATSINENDMTAKDIFDDWNK